MSFTKFEKIETIVPRVMPEVGPAPYTPGWYEARKSTIGASEAAAVCGLSRYAQPLEIYNRKKKDLKPEPQTKAQRRGHVFEDATLTLYSDRVGGTLLKTTPMLVHPTWKFMSATPDAIWMPDVLERDPNLLQVLKSQSIPVDAKTTMHWNEFGEEGTDDIPQEYVMQAQQQMAVTGAPRCDLPVLKNMDVSIYSVVRNDELIGHIMEAEKEMMERLGNNDPPAPNWEHPKTYDIIRSMYDVTETSKEMADESAGMWLEASALSEQKNRLEKAIKALKAQVLDEMGDCAVGNLPNGGQLVRKTIKREAREVAASEYVRLTFRKERKN